MIGFVKIDGKTIRYSKDGNGEPLVLIHGLGSFIGIWSRNVDDLARDFTVYALDLPGHGDSSPLEKEELNLEFSSRFLEKFFDILRLDRFILAGTSLGGLVALRYILDYPNRVDKLILIGSAGLGRGISRFLRAMSLPFVGEYFSRPNPKFVRSMFEMLVYNKDCISEEMVREFVSIRSKKELRENMLGLLRYGVNMRGQKKHIVHVSELHKIHIPVLLLWGENDPVFPPDQAYHAAKHLPCAILRVLPETGHLAYLEHPEEFRKAIVEFALGASPK